METCCPYRLQGLLSLGPQDTPCFLLELVSPRALPSVCAQGTQRGEWGRKGLGGLWAASQLPDQVRAGTTLLRGCLKFPEVCRRRRGEGPHLLVPRVLAQSPSQYTSQRDWPSRQHPEQRAEVDSRHRKLPRECLMTCEAESMPRTAPVEGAFHERPYEGLLGARPHPRHWAHRDEQSSGVVLFLRRYGTLCLTTCEFLFFFF